jgi:hypothetical protein
MIDAVTTAIMAAAQVRNVLLLIRDLQQAGTRHGAVTPAAGLSGSFLGFLRGRDCGPCGSWTARPEFCALSMCLTFSLTTSPGAQAAAIAEAEQHRHLAAAGARQNHTKITLFSSLLNGKSASVARSIRQAAIVDLAFDLDDSRRHSSTIRRGLDCDLAQRRSYN